MKEAMFYRQLENGKVECDLCPHFCTLKDGQIGNCFVRKNVGGKLFSLVYGKAVAVHVDPIEKKPLFHVAPGSRSFSLATVGCNFHCKFCQNADISQISKEANVETIGQSTAPEELVSLAISNSCQSIAFTYTEPTVFFEYAYDTAKLAHQAGLLNIFVTNGYINAEPVNFIKDYLDAANVDLKSFSGDFYRRLVGAKLQPVLETLKLMKKLNIWIEITTLVIPDENDAEEELTEIASFIKNELGEETPWHLSRFYPQYKLNNRRPTPISTLQHAYEIGKQHGLRFVYLGNVPGDETESTFCYQCGKKLIDRYGYHIREKNVIANRCSFCGVAIDGIGL